MTTPQPTPDSVQKLMKELQRRVREAEQAEAQKSK